MSSQERRPFDDTDERVMVSKARGHFPQEHLYPTRCVTCGERYPCQHLNLPTPVGLGTRYWIGAPILGLIVLTVLFVVLSR